MKYSLNEFLILKKNLTDKKPVNIVTGSMEPWIKAGEKVFVVPAQFQNLKPYDIVIFWDKKLEILICHILVEIGEKTFVTKPLRSKKADPPTAKEFLLGRVVEPQFGLIQKILLKLFH